MGIYLIEADIQIILNNHDRTIEFSVVQTFIERAESRNQAAEKVYNRLNKGLHTTLREQTQKVLKINKVVKMK